MTDLVQSPYASWIGRERQTVDEMDAAPATRLARALDSSRSFSRGESLPEGWQCVHFLPSVRQSQLGPDGAEQRGLFFPVVSESARRLFGGTEAVYHHALVLGQRAELAETIDSIVEKPGRSGTLLLVRVRRRISQQQQLAIEEQQTLVFAAPAAATAPAPQPAPLQADWRVPLQPDPVLLFRFSALTFNAHRIHYDRDYGLSEGYGGLVVHGPLLALLLLHELQQRCSARVAQYRFRALRPLLDTASFKLCGRIEGANAELWVQGEDGSLSARAEARLRGDAQQR